jgi:hypothetical protein
MIPEHVGMTFLMFSIYLISRTCWFNKDEELLEQNLSACEISFMQPTQRYMTMCCLFMLRNTAKPVAFKRALTYRGGTVCRFALHFLYALWIWKESVCIDSGFSFEQKAATCSFLHVFYALHKQTPHKVVVFPFKEGTDAYIHKFK